MEVHSLTLHLTEADLNELLRKSLPEDFPIEELQIVLTSEGVCVRGVYPLLVNVSFECWWQADVGQGKVRGRITRLRAMGMPGMVFKSAVLRALESAGRSEYWLTVSGEEVLIDPEFLLSRYAIPGRLNLRSIRFLDGSLYVEGGRDAGSSDSSSSRPSSS